MGQNSYKGFNQNQGKPGGIIHCCASVCFCFDLWRKCTVQTIALILVIFFVCLSTCVSHSIISFSLLSSPYTTIAEHGIPTKIPPLRKYRHFECGFYCASLESLFIPRLGSYMPKNSTQHLRLNNSTKGCIRFIAKDCCRYYALLLSRNWCGFGKNPWRCLWSGYISSLIFSI